MGFDPFGRLGDKLLAGLGEFLEALETEAVTSRRLFETTTSRPTVRMTRPNPSCDIFIMGEAMRPVARSISRPTAM